jgi:hypothetical protein
MLRSLLLVAAVVAVLATVGCSALPMDDPPLVDPCSEYTNCEDCVKAGVNCTWTSPVLSFINPPYPPRPVCALCILCVCNRTKKVTCALIRDRDPTQYKCILTTTYLANPTVYRMPVHTCSRFCRFSGTLCSTL